MQDPDNFEARHSELINSLRGRISDERVLSAMSRVPRHLFVPMERIESAYEDIPLSIGSGQTISQPYIVAIMTSALDLNSDDVVMEIGTGSGYQAAVLAELCRKVYTVERLPLMATRARQLLKSLGYSNIEVGVAGSELGWKSKAPFDAILVAAAAPEIPENLLKQLKPGGRMVIPVGSRHQQELLKITRGTDDFDLQKLGGCRFVSLIGEEAWHEQQNGVWDEYSGEH